MYTFTTLSVMKHFNVRIGLKFLKAKLIFFLYFSGTQDLCPMSKPTFFQVVTDVHFISSLCFMCNQLDNLFQLTCESKWKYLQGHGLVTLAVRLLPIN